ncbi:hypothetical protein FPV67DRAFT_1702738 [Lyophyllum atratum]|nr:hypothetical protein FPV67DRAFT_1702738 [Lyophyllum atratum]
MSSRLCSRSVEGRGKQLAGVFQAMTSRSTYLPPSALPRGAELASRLRHLEFQTNEYHKPEVYCSLSALLGVRKTERKGFALERELVPSSSRLSEKLGKQAGLQKKTRQEKRKYTRSAKMQISMMHVHRIGSIVANFRDPYTISPIQIIRLAIPWLYPWSSASIPRKSFLIIDIIMWSALEGEEMDEKFTVCLGKPTMQNWRDMISPSESGQREETVTYLHYALIRLK